MNTKLYQEIAALVQARLNCIASHNSEWEGKHEDKIRELCENYLPHGSGFDSGTSLDIQNSKPNKLVFYADFHHMDENGFYDGWTNHSIIVTSSLSNGFDLRITGRDRDGWKEYAYETFDYILNQEIKNEAMERIGL